MRNVLEHRQGSMFQSEDRCSITYYSSTIHLSHNRIPCIKFNSMLFIYYIGCSYCTKLFTEVLYTIVTGVDYGLGRYVHTEQW